MQTGEPVFCLQYRVFVPNILSECFGHLQQQNTYAEYPESIKVKAFAGQNGVWIHFLTPHSMRAKGYGVRYLARHCPCEVTESPVGVR